MNAIVLRTRELEVTCLPEHGMLLSEIVPAAIGVNLLWQRPNAPLHSFVEPAQASAMGDPFDAEVFAGGWFGMFPNAGIPGANDADEQMHGSFPRFAWNVLQYDDTSLICELEVEGLRAVRTVQLDGTNVRVSTEVENRGATDREVSFGEHPCFARSVFAGGELALRAARAHTTSELSEPGANRFLAGQDFTWPIAVERLGGSARTDVIPVSADGSHDHLCVTLADPEIILTAPDYAGSVRLSSDLTKTAELLFWRHFQPPGSPWHGDVFGIEMMSTPGRTRDDARAANALRWLRAGEKLSWSLEVQWQNDLPRTYG